MKKYSIKKIINTFKSRFDYSIYNVLSIKFTYILTDKGQFTLGVEISAFFQFLALPWRSIFNQ